MDYFLDDAKFEILYNFLQAEKKIHTKKKKKIRLFLEAVFWICRSGGQWRLLPKEYGKWNSVYKKFAHWSEIGVWERMFKFVAQVPDMQSVMIDSTVVRAQACAAGALKKMEDKRSKH